MKKLIIAIIDHRNNKRLGLQFNYEKGGLLDKIVRNIKDRKWSNTKKCWHLPYRDDYEKYYSNYFSNYPSVQLIFKDKKQPSKAILTIYTHSKKIGLWHDYHEALYKDIVSLGLPSYFSKQLRQRVFEGTNENLTKLKFLIFKNKLTCQIIKKVPDWEKDEEPLIKHFVDALKMKNYSTNTIAAYYPHFKNFMEHYKERQLESFQYVEIKNYIQNTLAT